MKSKDKLYFSYFLEHTDPATLKIIIKFLKDYSPLAIVENEKRCEINFDLIKQYTFELMKGFVKKIFRSRKN